MGKLERKSKYLEHEKKSKIKTRIGTTILILSCIFLIGLVIYTFTCVSGWENVSVVNMGQVEVCGELGADKLISIFGFWGLFGFLIFILIIMFIGAGLINKRTDKNG